MAIINELEIGEVPGLEGVKLYRKFDIEKGFTPIFFVLPDELTFNMASRITVHYTEYYKNSQGVETAELQKLRSNKTYMVMNQEEVKNESGDIIIPKATKAIDWYYIDIPDGVTFGEYTIYIIESILQSMPLAVQNCYVVK